MNELDKCYRDLNMAIIRVLAESARALCARRQEIVNAERSNPPRPGFFYTRKLKIPRQRRGFLQEYEMCRHILIIREKGDKVLGVPVYDSPYLGHNGRLSGFPLPGYGDPVANWSEAKWIKKTVLSSWLLCAVLEDWRLKIVLQSE
jgi:hypothetical protein